MLRQNVTCPRWFSKAQRVLFCSI